MGACSSKPKTIEVEGSFEPRKPIDVAADQPQPQETERSLQNLADGDGKETPAEMGEGKGEGAHASKEVMQTRLKPEAGKDASEEQIDVLGEKEVAYKEAIPEVEHTERKVDIIPDEVVPKDDVGGGGVADNASAINNDVTKKEGSVLESMVQSSFDNKEESVPDEAETCEDKAIVSEVTGSSQGDVSHADKTCALDEDKASETPEKRNIIVPEGDANALCYSAGVESPITGVIQAVEPMNEEDHLKIVATEVDPCATHDDSQEDSKAAQENCTTGSGNVDVHGSATEDAQKDVLVPSKEDSSQGIEASVVEISSPISTIETLAPVSALGTLAPAKADPSMDGEEGTSQTQGEAPSDAVVNVAPATVDAKNHVNESSTDTKNGICLNQGVVDQNEDSHANIVQDRGSVGSLEMETPKTIEDTAFEVSSIESESKDGQKESIKEKDALIEKETDVGSGKAHTLATEKADEDRGSVDSLEMETPKTIEDTAFDVTTIESESKDRQKESVKEKDALIEKETDVGSGKAHALATDKANEDGRPMATLGGSTSEREEKHEPIPEPTVEGGKDSTDKPHVEHMSSGDVVFEDASDTPLKLEASKSIESGQVPS